MVVIEDGDGEMQEIKVGSDRREEAVWSYPGLWGGNYSGSGDSSHTIQ